MQRSYTANSNLFLFATIISSLVALSSLINHSSAQNCGCSSDLCCSQYGYCGTGDAYCGSGCQSGPCYGSSGGGGGGDGGGGSVADVVTDDFFNGILAGAGSDCEGNGFYTRSAFLSAVGSFSDFGTTGSTTVQLQEIAAYFANVAHETGSLCYINEINGESQNYCDPSSQQYPCVSGQYYYGRGPLQLTWNYNYGAAGDALNFDGLGNPGAVAQDPVLSFQTSLWFWMGNCHGPITSGQGFGATIQAINGPIECNGGNPSAVDDRVNYYLQYCQQLGVSPGDNLYC